MNFEKCKNFFKNKYIILTGITLLALFIRLLNIVKPCGFWYDEMLTYIFSSSSFPVGIMKTLLKYDFHMPLYYMYVHIWMKLFGTNDVVLRLSSVIWGALTVPAFFYLGKTYKSEKLGYFLTIIGCLSPVLIYFSQEFRFYSMLVFFATLSLTAFLKLIDNPDKKSLILFAISNLIILYIYTMGILFVAVEFFLLFIYFYLYKKDYLKMFAKYSVILFVCAIPYLLLLYSYLVASKLEILDPFAWASSDGFSMLFILNDWFSPFIAFQYGPNSYFTYLKNIPLLIVLGFCTISTLCFLIGFISGLRQSNKKLISLVIILSGFLSVEIFMALTGDFVIVTRYTLICLPIVLLISVDGLLSIESKRLRNTLVSLIFIVFIYNIINYTKMPAFMERLAGYKTLTNKLETLNIQKNDYILYSDKTELIRKYFNKGQIIAFDIPSIIYLDKTKQEALKVFDKNFVYSTNKKNSLPKLIAYLEYMRPTKELTTYINNKTKKIPKGNRIIFIEDYKTDDLTPREAKIFAENAQSGNEIILKTFKSMLFGILFNKINDDIITVLNENSSLKFVKTMIIKSPNKKPRRWRIFIYEKI